MYFFAMVSILFALVALFYQEMPLFVPKLPFSWLLGQGLKRSIFRAGSILCLVVFVRSQSPTFIRYGLVVIVAGLLIGSIIMSGERLFRSLKPSDLLKARHVDIPSETLVVGYIGKSGSAICYPVHDLVSPRHIINDIVDGDPILVTYCPSCGSCAILSRIVDGRAANFSVAAGIFHKNMIMIDDVSGTLWQQAIGEGIKGANEDTRLEFLSFQQVPLQKWKALYPDTLIASAGKHAPVALLSQKHTARLLKLLSHYRGMKSSVDKLRPTDEVVGVVVGDLSKAYPLKLLEVMQANTLKDYIGGVPILIMYDKSSGLIIVRRTDTNKLIITKRIWWLGWKEFYPNSDVYSGVADSDVVGS